MQSGGRGGSLLTSSATARNITFGNRLPAPQVLGPPPSEGIPQSREGHPQSRWVLPRRGGTPTAPRSPPLGGYCPASERGGIPGGTLRLESPDSLNLWHDAHARDGVLDGG
jgi:hypothetical protein